VQHISNTDPAKMTLRQRANLEKSPGSDTALDAGCKCPVLDNAHGIGYHGVWGNWVSSFDCPLHAPVKAKPELKNDGAGWTLVCLEEEDNEDGGWGIVRTDFWREHGHLDDREYADCPDLPDLEGAAENSFHGDPNLDEYRARGFEVLEDPIWWYDKRFIPSKPCAP
jgi:hypothetical protein